VHELNLSAGLPFAPGRTIFADAAFGARPDITAAELPAADDAVESWLRAVVLGGQGRYAAAHAELRRTGRLTRDPVLRSLAASTEASLLRQLGWHARAATVDGRALGLASGAEDSYVTNITEPICDALTGLAADALGTARPALAARLLERCRGPVEAAGGWRPLLRWHWVCAETALAAPGSGLIAAPAREHAEVAVEIAQGCPSIRHRVKSGLLLAAATAASGDLGHSAELAAGVADRCAEYGLLPLRWATAMLRGGVETGSAATRAAAEAADCARELAIRGGRLRSETGVLGEF